MIFVALIHYPVLNRHGEVINSAVTNLDIHDISRASRTYGVKRYYVVTPLHDQQQLAADLAGHWLHGTGGEKNPDRKNAIGIMKITDSLESAVADIVKITGQRPAIYATSAINRPESVSWAEMREKIADRNRPFLLVFGTASGLADEIIAKTDGIISPIQGPSKYNHLSVRSAASITLDRLLGI
jgi:hypothetical protein